jgi:hypothetical protein
MSANHYILINRGRIGSLVKNSCAVTTPQNGKSDHESAETNESSFDRVLGSLKGQRALARSSLSPDSFALSNHRPNNNLFASVTSSHLSAWNHPYEISPADSELLIVDQAVKQH